LKFILIKRPFFVFSIFDHLSKKHTIINLWLKQPNQQLLLQKQEETNFVDVFFVLNQNA